MLKEGACISNFGASVYKFLFVLKFYYLYFAIWTLIKYLPLPFFFLLPAPHSFRSLCSLFLFFSLLNFFHQFVWAVFTSIDVINSMTNSFPNFPEHSRSGSGKLAFTCFILSRTRNDSLGFFCSFCNTWTINSNYKRSKLTSCFRSKFSDALLAHYTLIPPNDSLSGGSFISQMTLGSESTLNRK